MKYKLRLLNTSMGYKEYQMYQDIPKEEMGSTNPINGVSYKEYKEILKAFKKEERVLNPKANSTTNRYIFYVNNVPIGEIAIRTTKNNYWLNKGSQIFYKIKKSERNKGYGTKMLELALKECKEIGMKSVGINCNDKNIASKRIIEKNGGKFLFNYGESSRYEIKF